MELDKHMTNNKILKHAFVDVVKSDFFDIIPNYLVQAECDFEHHKLVICFNGDNVQRILNRDILGVFDLTQLKNVEFIHLHSKIINATKDYFLTNTDEKITIAERIKELNVQKKGLFDKKGLEAIKLTFNNDWSVYITGNKAICNHFIEYVNNKLQVPAKAKSTITKPTYTVLDDILKHNEKTSKLEQDAYSQNSEYGNLALFKKTINKFTAEQYRIKQLSKLTKSAIIACSILISSIITIALLAYTFFYVHYPTLGVMANAFLNGFIIFALLLAAKTFIQYLLYLRHCNYDKWFLLAEKDKHNQIVGNSFFKKFISLLLPKTTKN